MQKEINFDKPKSVRLEACTICQLNCECCYMRKSNHTLGIGYLTFENFKKFIDENNFIKSIELSNSGEIFLNPDLLKIIKYSYEKGVELTAYNGVNFNTVSDEMIEALVKYKFKKITCSIDGASQETYSIYRVGGDFEKVISNLRKLNDYKAKYNSEYPLVKYQFIIFGHNEHEIKKAKEIACELNAEINFKFSWDKNYSPIKNETLVREAIGFTQLSDTEYEHKKSCFLKSFCVKMWTQPQINWDGRLIGCCRLADKDYGVNVFDIGLETALKSPKFSYAKKMLMNKESAKPCIPCASCDYYQRLADENIWISEDEILEYLL